MALYDNSSIYLNSKRNKQCTMFCGDGNPFCITSGLCITRAMIVGILGIRPFISAVAMMLVMAQETYIKTTAAIAKQMPVSLHIISASSSYSRT
jgi:hypothetical protein